MVDWEQRMEEEWGRAFVHESGHALMATLQELPCHGIYYQKSEKAGKFCTLVPTKPADERTNKDYLFLAAGAAAENLIYNSHDEEAAGADKRDFDLPEAPEFDDAFKDASGILLAKKRHIKRLVSMLKAKVRRVDFDLGRLPEIGMDGSQQRYSVMLSTEELEAAVRRP